MSTPNRYYRIARLVVRLKKGRIISLIVLIALVWGAVLVYRNGVHPKLVLWIVKQSWDRTQDFEATLQGDTQVLGFTVTGAGRLRFKRPALYDLDLNTLRVIAGDKSLWVVVPALKTGVRVTSPGMTPAQMLGSVVSDWTERDPARWVDQATSDESEVTLWATQEMDGQRCWLLEWPARTGERVGGRLYVGQSTRAPVRFDQMDSGGRIVHQYKISNFRRNVGLKAQDFDYKPMEGYTTLEYTYDPNDPGGLKRLLDSSGPAFNDLRQKVERELGPAVREYLKRK
jgi:outer membrane lipoprotein-sorting protein